VNSDDQKIQLQIGLSSWKKLYLLARAWSDLAGPTQNSTIGLMEFHQIKSHFSKFSSTEIVYVGSASSKNQIGAYAEKMPFVNDFKVYKS